MSVIVATHLVSSRRNCRAALCFIYGLRQNSIFARRPPRPLKISPIASNVTHSHGAGGLQAFIQLVGVESAHLWLRAARHTAQQRMKYSNAQMSTLTNLSVNIGCGPQRRAGDVLTLALGQPLMTVHRSSTSRMPSPPKTFTPSCCNSLRYDLFQTNSKTDRKQIQNSLAGDNETVVHSEP